MPFRFNPFTGTLDYVGTSGGGGGTVTSVAGGTGITNSPEPIVGAGTVDLDIDSLTTLVGALAAGDLFPFVDVSGGGTAVANQRKVAFSDLATAIEAILGGPFQPLDAGLTALASLTPAGIAVTDGADGWFTREVASGAAGLTVTDGAGQLGNITLTLDDDLALIAGFGGASLGIVARTGNPAYAFRTITATDSASVDFTVTNGNGVAGNPTITAVVLAAGVDHGGLAGLLDDDHTQYLLLAGRAGSTNDPTISTGALGTIYGSDDALGSLLIRASSNASQGTIRCYDDVKLWTGHKSVTGTTATPLEWDLSFGGVDTTYDDATAVFHILNVQGSLNLVVNPGAGDYVQFRNALNQIAGTGITAFVTGAAVASQPRHTANTGAAIITSASTGCSHEPNFITNGTGTMSGLIDYGYRLRVVGSNAGAGLTVAESYGLEVRAPVLTGGATLEDFFGIYIADFTTTSDNFAYVSLGANHSFVHGGKMRVGNASLTVLATDVVAAFHGHINTSLSASGTTPEIRYRDPGGVNFTALRAQAQAGNITYDFPAAAPVTNGEALTATTAGVMSWAAMQPLDADLTAIAGLTVAQGALIIGSAAPAWSVLGIGATDLYLRSNGTTAAWAAVTELGLVDTYNGITTAGVGMPAIVAAVDLTGQTANIGLSVLYAAPADGLYRVSAYVIVTTVGTVTSTLPQVNIAWTDGVSGVAQSTVLTGGVGATPTPPPGYASSSTQSATANTTTTLRSGDMIVFANASSNIQYSTSGYASNAATTMNYAIHIRVERI